MKSITINDHGVVKTLGEGAPCFIIAELSANHGADLEKAKEIVRKAAAAGVDAIKVQTYTAEGMTIDCDKEDFIVGGGENPESWGKETLFSIYQKAYTPWAWHQELQKLTNQLGMFFFSSPFDPSAVDRLETLDVPLYKVASYEVVDIPLLERIGTTQKPVIMSTGFASQEEIDLAVQTLKTSGCPILFLLHCRTDYRSSNDQNILLETANFATMEGLSQRYSVSVGFSDNNGGVDVPLQALAYGAKIIEKHIVLSHQDTVLDEQFSLDPLEFCEFIKAVRNFELDPTSISKDPRCFGTLRFGSLTKEESRNQRYRKSLYVVEDVKAGDLVRFGIENSTVRVIRPGFGLAPKHYPLILGKTFSRDVEKGEALTWEMLNLEESHDYSKK